MNERILAFLTALYGEETAQRILPRLRILLANYAPQIPRVSDPSLTERDALLITYGDQVCEPGVPPLATLGEFCHTYLKGLLTILHILPFFP